MYELRRGVGDNNHQRGRRRKYSPKRAQAQYEDNRQRCRWKHRIEGYKDFLSWLHTMVKKHKWSLDACVGYARVNRLFPNEILPCTKTLYNELWKSNLKLTLFDVPEVLRRNTKRNSLRRHKRLYETSIDERPQEVNQRLQFGHREIDTLIGKKKGKEAVALTLLKENQITISRLNLRIRAP